MESDAEFRTPNQNWLDHVETSEKFAENYCRLGCGTMQFHRCLQMFLRSLTASQQTIIFVITTMRISNLTGNLMLLGDFVIIFCNNICCLRHHILSMTGIHFISGFMCSIS
jgi:hypothetical protein